MIVLTDVQTARLLFKDQHAFARLRPLRCTDNRYALPESALTDPYHARWRSILQAGSIEEAGTLTFAADNTYNVSVDSKEMFLYTSSQPEIYGYPAPRLFDIPATNTYRFEPRHNSDTASGDWPASRRVELLQPEATGFDAGETLWESWSTVMTDARTGFEMDHATIIHQWHAHRESLYPVTYPFMTVCLRDRKIEFGTRSSADDGLFHQWYYDTFDPDSGVPVNFVMSGLLGESGHLDVWMDGTQIVDEDTPIGYYDEDPPMSCLAVVQFGAYMPNVGTTDVIYHANPEFGTASLAARVASPLAVNAPPEGWI